MHRIASLAETYGAQLAPHCPLGPIAPAASLQVAFATPNFLVQEQSRGIHYNKDADLLSYLVAPEPFRLVAGHAAHGDLPRTAGGGPPLSPRTARGPCAQCVPRWWRPSAPVTPSPRASWLVCSATGTSRALRLGHITAGSALTVTADRGPLPDAATIRRLLAMTAGER